MILKKIAFKRIALVSAFAFILAGCGDNKKADTAGTGSGDKFAGTWSYTESDGLKDKITFKKLSSGLYSDGHTTFKDFNGKLYPVASAEDKKNLAMLLGGVNSKEYKKYMKEMEEDLKKNIEENEKWAASFKDKDTIIIVPMLANLSADFYEHEAHRAEPDDTEAKK